MTQEPDRHAIAVLYKAVETDVGTNIYAHIQCFRGKPSEGSVTAFRTSAPFSLACRYGIREVVPGSVVETLRNIRRLIERLSQSTVRSGARLDGLTKGAHKDAVYQEYEQEVTNALVLVSCHLRNVLHTFPAVGEKLTVSMYDYEEKPTESVKMHTLLDMFVHNRYMHLHNEYITDLFSGRPPAGTVFAEKFMGYRFKVNDFLLAAQQAIRSVTLKHLATRLRSEMRRLTTETPHYDMVFLIQNVASLSNLLEALLPTGKDVLWGMLYPTKEVPAVVVKRARGRDATVAALFHTPRVRMGNRVDDDSKTISVSVEGTFRYTVDERIVHSESADRETEVEYGEFFDRVIKAGGDESVLALSDQKDEIRTTHVEGAR